MTTLSEKLIIQLAADISDLKRGMNEATAAVEKPGKAAKKAAAEQNAANQSVLKSALDVKRTYTQIAGVIALVGAAVGAAVTPFLKWDDAMKELAAVAGTANKPLANIEERIKSLASAAGQFGGDIADKVKAGIGALGGDVEKSLMAVQASARAAMLGVMTEQEAMAALAPVVKAYRLAGDDIEKAMATIETATEMGAGDPGALSAGLVEVSRDAAKSGVSLQQVATAMVNLTQNGASTGEAVGIIKTVFENSVAPTEAVAAAAGKLGLNWQQGAVSGGTFAGILETIRQNAEAGNPAVQEFLGGSEQMVAALAGVSTTGASFASTFAAMGKAIDEFSPKVEKAISDLDRLKAAAAKAQMALATMPGTLDQIGAKLSQNPGLWAQLFGAVGSPSKPGSGILTNPDQLAAGGSVGGFGSSDTVPAMLTPGEFVVKKKVAESMRPFLVQLNRGNLGGAHVLWNTLLANTQVKGMSLLHDILGIKRKQIGNFGPGVNMATIGHQNEALARIASGMMGALNSLSLSRGGTVPQRFASGGSVGGGGIHKSTTINGGVSLNMGGQALSPGFIRRQLIPTLERLGDRGQSRRSRTGR